MSVPRYYAVKRIGRAVLLGFDRVPLVARWTRPLARRLALYSFSDATGYFSQWGQDKFVDQCVFAEQRRGTFVDIGANDGVTCSNTYFLESARGWDGLCVEPQPDVFEKLRARRRCRCVQACAGTENGEVTFQMVEGPSNLLSGRPDRFPPGHEYRIAESIRSDGGRVRSIAVPCVEINALIAEQGISSIDFLSIDTEGGEADLVASIDLEGFRVRAIAIENNYDHRRIEDALRPRGFDLVAWMGSDEIYVRRHR